MTPSQRTANNNKQQGGHHIHAQPHQYDSMGNPIAIGNLSDSLAGLSVGNYSTPASTGGILDGHRQHSGAVGVGVGQDRNPTGSTLSALGEGLELNWASS